MSIIAEGTFIALPHETAGIMNQFRNVVYQKGHDLVKQNAFGGGGLNP